MNKQGNKNVTVQLASTNCTEVEREWEPVSDSIIHTIEEDDKRQAFRAAYQIILGWPRPVINYENRNNQNESEPVQPA